MKSTAAIFGTKLLTSLIFILLTMVGHGKVIASTEDQIRIGIVDNALPCSDYNGQEYVGSAVDLWRAIADSALLEYEIKTIKNPKESVKQAANGTVDLAISCLNIIAPRLEQVEFSVPYQSDSLAFLSRKEDEVRLITVFSKIFSSKIIITTLILLYGVTLFASIILWLISDGFKDKDVQCANTYHTFLKGWMMLAMGGGIYKLADNAQKMSIITLVNISRLVMSSILVGTIASLIFQQKKPEDGSSNIFLEETIQERIGVDQGTVSELWITEQARSKLKAPNKYIISLSGDENLLDSLKSGKVNSIVADHQRIKLLAKMLEGNSKFHVAASTFNETPQAFIFGRDLSEIRRKQINVSISSLMFTGKVDSIIKRWQ